MNSEKNNILLKPIFIGVLILIIIGWIGWVSGSIRIGDKERSMMRIDIAVAAKELETTKASIVRIELGIKNLTDYFMLPKPIAKDKKDDTRDR